MKAKWIWYYGDFEMYHSLKLHTRREGLDYMFPPFWRLDDCNHNVCFEKIIELDKNETVKIYARGAGHAFVDGKRTPLEKEINLSKGTHKIDVHIADRNGLPCIFVEGNTIVSDESWLVNNYGKEWINAGANESYTEKTDNPQEFKFSYEEIKPVSKKLVNGGVLYDFGKETFAKLCFDKLEENIDIFYGESETEALDTVNAYLRVYATNLKEQPCRAFRYLFIKGNENKYNFKAYYEYLPLEYKGSFKCDNEMINKIWDTSAYTLHLNSREFFLDGIKRDRWVWSGDAYQSYLVSRYVFFDEDIIKRTILALRGKDPVEKHINTILDYSFYWIMSIYDYYEMTADKEFIQRIYPKMKSLMDFCLSRLDKNGFASKVDDDWIFIDWADMDKTGAVCAEQMLLLRSLETMALCGKILGIDGDYDRQAVILKEKINKYFWNEEKGAYIDSFESGKNQVTRHANIFAMMFGIADEKQKESIIKNVLLNDSIPQIKTPYFKFYELEALCEIGEFEEVLERMCEYWGSMLDLGATSFWEEYNPEKSLEEQYPMYGDKFGKSFCHAWGASPIYIIGKFYLGVQPTSAGYETFEVKPFLDMFAEVNATVPVKGGKVSIKKKNGILEVTSSRNGGVLIYKSKQYTLKAENTVIVTE